MATLARHRITYAELDELPDDGILYEILDGVLVTRAAPTRRHQQIVGALYTQLRRAQDAGIGELILGPFDVVLDEYNATLPDLLFVRTDHAHIVTDTGCFGAPDLIVEILSPTSIERDLKEKLSTYEHFGVSAYWIIDPASQELLRFNLVRGRYVKQLVLHREDAITSPLFPAIHVALRDVFSSPALPKEPDAQPSAADLARIRELEKFHHRRRPRPDRQRD